MPLSDREQKILEEIEQSLVKEDPRFAREAKRIVPHAEERRKVQAGAALFLVGFAILIGFFVTGQVLLGVLAFGAMVGGVVMVAGSIPAFLGGNGRSRAVNERLSDAAKSWEEKLRDRYRKG